LFGYLYAPHGGSWPDHIVTATVTDGAPGVYEYFLRTKDPEVIEVFDSIAKWMLASLWVWDEEMLYDFVDLRTGKVFGTRRDIYDIRNVARPNIEGSFFRLAWKLTGKKRYRDAFESQCKITLSKQNKNGLYMEFEPNIARTGYVHPRFNLWYAEALLECQEEFGEARYLKAAKRTLDYYAKHTDSAGRVLFPDKKGRISAKDMESGSAFAFSALLMLEISKREKQPELYAREIAAIASWLLATQLSPEEGWDPVLSGAYRDIKKSEENSVYRDLGTIFSVRFLAAYRKTLSL
jgi:hypothetical protein